MLHRGVAWPVQAARNSSIDAAQLKGDTGSEVTLSVTGVTSMPRIQERAQRAFHPIFVSLTQHLFRMCSRCEIRKVRLSTLPACSFPVHYSCSSVRSAKIITQKTEESNWLWSKKDLQRPRNSSAEGSNSRHNNPIPSTTTQLCLARRSQSLSH